MRNDKDIIYVAKLDEVDLYVDSSDSIRGEIREYFTFFAKNFFYSPKYKNHMWDGRISLFDRRTSTLPYGLLPHLLEFAKERAYEIEIDPELLKLPPFDESKLQNLIASCKLPHALRDYQYESLVQCLKNGRLLLLSPTSSGKSLIIYLIMRYLEKKTLIVVPNNSLVLQMYNDFGEYSENDPTFVKERRCHLVYDGAEKNTDKQIVISTWQAIYKSKENYFQQYECVIGDECHHFQATSLTGIMDKLKTCRYRFGTTGTIEDLQIDKLKLQGMFGAIYRSITTDEMMKRGFCSQLNIKCIILKHNPIEIRSAKRKQFQDQIEYICKHKKRNAFVANLAISMKTNTLVLFRSVEHGKFLYQLIKERADRDRYIELVYGNTEAEVRERIRNVVETKKDAIIVASLGVFSTGINIRNLYTAIFACPMKGKIKLLQSIGRILRIGDDSNQAVVYDVIDDLRLAKNNYPVHHFRERLKSYISEKHKYKLYTISL